MDEYNRTHPIQMTWENRKETWELDHVIPMSFFDLRDDNEKYMACHWSNMQPLPIGENRAKGDKILKDHVLSHMAKIKQFLKQYPDEGYQTSMETCWWQRVDSWYGKNPFDQENDDDIVYRDNETLFQRAIRSQVTCH